VSWFALAQIVASCHNLRFLAAEAQVLGTDSFYAYLNKYGLELDPQLEALVGR
jgi:hypothetical protein